jgi:hypothetical protein
MYRGGELGARQQPIILSPSGMQPSALWHAQPPYACIPAGHSQAEPDSRWNPRIPLQTREYKGVMMALIQADRADVRAPPATYGPVSATRSSSEV